MTEDEVRATVSALDDLMHTPDEMDDHWRSVTDASIRLGGLCISSRDQADLALLLGSIPRRPHREAWRRARGWIRAGKRISQVTPSLPLVVQLAIDVRMQLDDIIAAIAPGGLRERIEKARAQVGAMADALYPPR